MSTTTFPRMHVSLYVSNIYATADFYSRFFGQDPAKIKPDYCKFELENPGLIISFVQNPEKVAKDFGHLGIQIGSEAELQDRLQQMQTRKVPVLEEMGTNCCYASQDKFWVTDPDGYHWEVYFFHQDVAFNDPRYASHEATACCTPEAAVATTVISEQATPKPKVKMADIANNSCAPGSGCC